MAISSDVEVIESALWPQGDIRDPLGVWGSRLGVTGDATGGEIKVQARVPATRSAAYVYTLYSALYAQLTGSVPTTNVALRLLTNWPDVDPVPQIQGFASTTAVPTVAFGSTPPLSSPGAGLVGPADRFILLFDPRQGRNDFMDIAELKVGANTDLATYSFEFYGYFWDRSVLNAPGGPRHPGAS